MVGHLPGTFRLRIANLPARFAQEAPHSAAVLVQVLKDLTGVDTYNACTYKRWLRVNGTFAYDFVEVRDEATGTKLIDLIHTCVLGPRQNGATTAYLAYVALPPRSPTPTTPTSHCTTTMSRGSSASMTT